MTKGLKLFAFATTLFSLSFCFDAQLDAQIISGGWPTQSFSVPAQVSSFAPAPAQYRQSFAAPSTYQPLSFNPLRQGAYSPQVAVQPQPSFQPRVTQGIVSSAQFRSVPTPTQPSRPACTSGG